MEATNLVNSLNTLRASFAEPVSDLEIIRRTMAAQVARAGGVEMPPLLNNDQRAAFAANIGLVTSFLETDDGADAVELLMNSWAAFVSTHQAVDATPHEAAPQ